MNGFDVCRFLKKDPATARIPVIFLTASASADEKVCGLELEATDYITKPFNPDELAYRVRGALRTKRLLDLLPPMPAQGRSARLMTLSQLHTVQNEKPWNPNPVIATG